MPRTGFSHPAIGLQGILGHGPESFGLTVVTQSFETIIRRNGRPPQCRRDSQFPMCRCAVRPIGHNTLVGFSAYPHQRIFRHESHTLRIPSTFQSGIRSTESFIHHLGHLSRPFILYDTEHKEPVPCLLVAHHGIVPVSYRRNPAVIPRQNVPLSQIFRFQEFHLLSHRISCGEPQHHHTEYDIQYIFHSLTSNTVPAPYALNSGAYTPFSFTAPRA